ncbi:MAG: PDDEXK nuclease domain-containing protein, partial [Planctomycetota bacterium]
MPKGYAQLVERIKARIQVAQSRAAQAANRELLRLYWQVGRDLVAEQARHEYGTRVVERLASDLAAAFPGIQGFSARNLWRMRAFFLAHRPTPVLPQPVAEPLEPELPSSVAVLPWAHHVLLLERVKAGDEREVYARLALEQGWSRATLTQQIATGLSRRRGKAITNFARTLPPPQSALAEESLKDPYVFDFLALTHDAREREIEQGLIEHVQQFLLELGVGFAFV